jgi:hypothetical protein
MSGFRSKEELEKSQELEDLQLRRLTARWLLGRFMAGEVKEKVLRVSVAGLMDVISPLIEEWTKEHTMEELYQMLQMEGYMPSRPSPMKEGSF